MRLLSLVSLCLGLALTSSALAKGEPRFQSNKLTELPRTESELANVESLKVIARIWLAETAQHQDGGR